MGKRYRRLKLICLCVIFVCCFSACGKSEEPKQAREDQQAEKETDKEKEEPELAQKQEEEQEHRIPAPSVSGRLSVKGTQLVDERGEAVQLKGISTHGIAWFPQYVNEELFGELHREWDVNVIRLAMYTAESGGYCTDGDKEELKELLRRGVEYAAADPLVGFENIMYTLHFYAATHTDALRDTMTAAIDAGLPVFVTEYGICDAGGSGGIDEAQADAWIQVMNEYKVSCVAWNLSNKEETSAIFRSSVDKVSGFTQEDLSESGSWLYQMLTKQKEERSL